MLYISSIGICSGSNMFAGSMRVADSISLCFDMSCVGLLLELIFFFWFPFRFYPTLAVYGFFGKINNMSGTQGSVRTLDVKQDSHPKLSERN